MKDKNKICIIIPAYNEEKRIGGTLEKYCKFFGEKKSKKALDFEILVVINNTYDRTEYIVKSHQKKCRELKYLNLKQGGKGFAVIQGFKEALKKGFDILGFVDADMATSPNAFYDLITNIKSYDGAIASRYISGARVYPKPTWQRIIASRIFNTLIRSLLFLPYKDTQCGAKIFKKDALKKCINNLTLSQWAFDVDMLYQLKKMGYKIKEVPTIWSDKKYSKVNLKKAGWSMFLAIIRLRILNSPLKKLVKF